MKQNRLNFWQKCDRIPPILARLLARVPHGRPLTDGEIASKSGLSADRVFIIQHMTDWSDVTLTEARRFLVGCRVDLCNTADMERVYAYLPREGKKIPTSWKYLRQSTDWRSRYEPLMRRWLASLKLS